jgi:hypothetical protein
MVLGASVARAAPDICTAETRWAIQAQRAPGPVEEYLETLGDSAYNQRTACAYWAASLSQRRRNLAVDGSAPDAPPARFILYPPAGTELRAFAAWLTRTGHVQHVEISRNFLVATIARRTSTGDMRALLDAPQIGYAEPDCDGPDYLTTSVELMPPMQASMRCWQRGARREFPNDPCIEELWGHSLIGWDSAVAARSVPRLVAVLDSGIDAAHEDLERNVLRDVVRRVSLHEPLSQGKQLNSRCATSGKCFPHGTEMAGTIGGRMDNGIGVAGVAPHSLLLPIVISRVDHGLLGRLSTIAEGIDTAVRAEAQIINISAKWPVDSRAIAEAVLNAVEGPEAGRRLIVTGYATSLDRDDRVREYFPSQYRCLPGVLAAVPGDMRGHDLSNPGADPNPSDGRIGAPGVDIVVTTTENSERGYALSEAAGASSAAAYVSGAVALAWGSPPLNRCDAQEIKKLLFCRSKSSPSTRYPWIHVDFLRELTNVDPGADCGTALAALGCH